MAVNWGMGVTVRPGDTSAADAFLQGRQLGQERRAKNALATIFGAGEQTAGAPVTVGANAPGGGIGGGQQGMQPDATGQAWNDLFRYDPRMAMQLRHQQQQQQAAQREQQSAGMLTVGKMLRAAKADPAKYGMIRQAAAQNGIDISRVPETYDPAWVDQQLAFVSAIETDGGEKISGIARELVDAGFKPGTPEFAEAMRGVINNKYATEYVDEAGNTRRRSALNLPGSPPAEQTAATPPPPPGFQLDAGGPQPLAAGGFRP